MLDKLIMIDNRELAGLIWLFIAFAVAVSKEEIRSCLGDLLRTFFQPVILVPLLLMFAYVRLEVWLGARMDLWNAGLAKGTVIWALGSGAVLFFNSVTARDDPNFFRNTVAATVGVTVFLEFFLNLFVLNIWVELVLQPVAAALAIGATVAATRYELRPAKTILDSLLAILGFALVGFIAWQIYQSWDQMEPAQLLRRFLLPIWLTIGLLPFLYGMRLYVTYDSALRRINWATSSSRARWRARFALIRSFHVRHNELQRFTGHWVRQLAEAPTYAAARQVIEVFRKEETEREQAAADEHERLERYAGVEGTDAEGRRLDRREFKETKEALRWLHTCQMGWFRRRGGRYRPDLLDIMGDTLTRYGLPEDHGITLTVADDGESWYAWRRTITGWCFAIGAAGPPPDQWEYDGPDPPAGFPGEDPAWGDTAFSDEVNRNWW